MPRSAVELARPRNVCREWKKHRRPSK